MHKGGGSGTSESTGRMLDLARENLRWFHQPMADAVARPVPGPHARLPSRALPEGRFPVPSLPSGLYTAGSGRGDRPGLPVRRFPAAKSQLVPRRQPESGAWTWAPRPRAQPFPREARPEPAVGDPGRLKSPGPKACGATLRALTWVRARSAASGQ